MEVIVLEDDPWWRDRIAQELAAAGHHCHVRGAGDFHPDALVAWRCTLGVDACAAIIDLTLAPDYDTANRRASFDAVSNWRKRGLLAQPVIFISGSHPTPHDQRQARELGGDPVVIKSRVDDWAALLAERVASAFGSC